MLLTAIIIFIIICVCVRSKYTDVVTYKKFYVLKKALNESNLTQSVAKKQSNLLY